MKFRISRNSLLARFSLLALAGLMSGSVIAEDTEFYVVRYSPGVNWKADVSYYEQPGIKKHLDYLKSFYEREIVLMSGPLVDLPGSMVIVRGGTLGAVRNFVDQDPAVVDKLMVGNVSGWKVFLSSLRKVPIPVVELDPDEPFRLERHDPDAPINLPRD